MTCKYQSRVVPRSALASEWSLDWTVENSCNRELALRSRRRLESSGSRSPMMLRLSALLVAACLSACTAPQKRPPLETWPAYKVTGTFGLLIRLPATRMNVRAADNNDAARLESAAENKRKEASTLVGASALSVLTAPLAILGIVNPMALQFGALPFAYADAAQRSSKDVERLRQEAEKAHLDAACSEQLAAVQPQLAENLQRALQGKPLQQTIQEEVRNALQLRTNLPVVLMNAQQGEAQLPETFLREAEERQLSTVVNIAVQSLDLRGGSTAGNFVDCSYKIVTTGYVVWWNIAEHLVVRSDSLDRDAVLRFDPVELPALLDQPDELQRQLASAFRDMLLATLNASTLRFPESKPRP